MHRRSSGIELASLTMNMNNESQNRRAKDMIAIQRGLADSEAGRVMTLDESMVRTGEALRKFVTGQSEAAAEQKKR